MNENLALVPGTSTPISINTINNGISPGGGCPAGGLNNSAYFDGQPGGNFGASGNSFQMDGATVTIPIQFNVICGQTYHFKFAIADVGDASYDSYVFLKAGSFASEAVNVTVATVSGDSTIVRGCTDADFIFTRPQSSADTAYTVNYEITGGSAVEGVDYDPLPDSVYFQPGQASDTMTLHPIYYDSAPDTSTVTITVKIVNQCGDTIVSSGTIYILKNPNITFTSADPTVYCSNDSVALHSVASGGMPPYSYQWNTGAVGDSANVKVNLEGPFDFYVTATDACGFKDTDTVHVNLLQTLSIDTLVSSPTQACANTGIASATVSGATGTPTYSWTFINQNPTDTVEVSTSTLAQNLSGGWYYFTVTDNICSMTDSVKVEAIGGPQAVINPDKTEGCNPDNFVFNNGSTGANSYQWNFGDGYFSVSNTNAQTHTFTGDSTTTIPVSHTVYLIASNGMCSDTTSVVVVNKNCGCMDPKALNYNDKAVVTDNSCIYHAPEIKIPNVFSPNGDGANDVLQFLKQDYLTGIEYWIFNRWGDVMFHTDELGKYWDGKINGNYAAPGVYFIKYTAKGIDGSTVNGQSFFQIVRPK